MGRAECTALVVVALLVIAFVGCIVPGIPPRRAWGAIEMQRVHLISEAMLRYAQDHGGKFPSGASSTEVFQKLIDGGYPDYYGQDASLFYFRLKGKTPGLNGHPLKPENVSFDVTGLYEVWDSDQVPLVFSTGFRVSYTPAASAQRLAPLEFRLPGFELFRPDPGPNHSIIVTGNRHAEVRTLFVTEDPANSYGSARDFIPATYKPDGKTYRQLTPEGVLPAK